MRPGYCPRQRRGCARAARPAVRMASCRCRDAGPRFGVPADRFSCHGTGAIMRAGRRPAAIEREAQNRIRSPGRRPLFPITRVGELAMAEVGPEKTAMVAPTTVAPGIDKGSLSAPVQARDQRDFPPAPRLPTVPTIRPSNTTWPGGRG